jgi:hypothetical protein
MCYYMQPPALKTGHLSKFQLETLFYIFYALPKDVLQAYAAQELYSREWKFHVELKLWFKRASPAEGGQFVYFDINSWERRLFNGNMNQNITSGLLPEDDIRVKFSSSWCCSMRRIARVDCHTYSYFVLALEVCKGMYNIMIVGPKLLKSLQKV